MPFVAVRSQWGQRIFSVSGAIFVLVLACGLSLSVWRFTIIRVKKIVCSLSLHFTNPRDFLHSTFNVLTVNRQQSTVNRQPSTTPESNYCSPR
jgi:hypothetical protein